VTVRARFDFPTSRPPQSPAVGVSSSPLLSKLLSNSPTQPVAAQSIVDDIAQYYDGPIILGEDLMEVTPG